MDNNDKLCIFREFRKKVKYFIADIKNFPISTLLWFLVGVIAGTTVGLHSMFWWCCVVICATLLYMRYGLNDEK